MKNRIAGWQQRLKRLDAILGLSLFVIVAASGAVWYTFAANATNRQDAMTNMRKGMDSNHAISFNLSAGNTFANVEQIAVQFPAGFTFSTGWAAADFAFTDGTARTIVAVASGPGVSTVGGCTAGVNNVGVAVDTTGRVVRLIACPGLTPSAPGAYVTLSIEGLPGNGTLTNPATAGSYTLVLSNAGGDCTLVGDSCRMTVAILDLSAITISATVPSTAVCGNNIVETGESCEPPNTPTCSATCQTISGGGGGGPPPDTTPPVISGVACSGVTKTSFNAIWATDEAADSLLRYGLTVGYGSTNSDGAYLNSHSLAAVLLTEGATYHYQVCSKDSAGNSICSSDYTCTTLDETPPIITNVVVSPITGTTATITWTTNENSTSFVDYGTPVGPPYASTTGSATPMTTTHSVTLTGLTPGATYNFRVRSGDASANEAFTTNASFTTTPPPDTTAPVITNVVVSAITANGATITWDTNEAATNFADYGLVAGPPYTTTTGTATPLVTTHSVILTGLAENTTYNYRVRSADAAANEATTLNATFKTLDVTAPVITNVQATNITTTGARITWTTNENSDSTVNYGLTTAYGSTKTSATSVTAHTIDLTGLTMDTTYNFVVVSKDPSNNTATSTNYTFKTLRPPPPVITAVTVTNITQTAARITWTTDTLANSTVNYGLTTSYGSNATNATMVTTGHLVPLTGLTKGKTYNFRVRSTDALGQEAISGNFTFATLPDLVPPANPTGFTATPGDSVVNLAWTNPTDPDFQGVVIVRSTGAFPTSPTGGDVIYTGTLTNFADNTVTNGVTYYYTIFAFDDVPNYSSGAVASAKPAGPPDTTPPGNVVGFTATPGNSQITLNWTAPTDLDYQGVKIIRKALTCPTTMLDGALVYDGNLTTVVDTNVVNGTLYCYRAFSYDAIPNYSTGTNASATPVAPPDTTPPGPVTNFQAVAGDAVIQLTWTNPTDADWAGTRVVRKTGSQPSGPTDGTIVVDGVFDNKLDTMLTNGTNYFYGAYAFDSRPNYASGAYVNATPNAAAPPPPPPSCTDTDGGQSYDVKGSVTIQDGSSETDVCVAGQVKEFYCDAGVRKSELHTCASGFRCTDGHCAAETVNVQQSVCGNGVCDGNENSINCLADCPVAPIAPPVVPVTPPPAVANRINSKEILFFATSGNLQLQVQQNMLVQVYPAMTIRIYVPDSATFQTVKSAFVNFLGASYAMRETHSWETTVTSPSALGMKPFQIIVNYDDGTSETVNGNFNVVPYGQVYERQDDGSDSAITGARVSLYQDIGGGNFGLWNGSTFGEQNPQMTANNGSFTYIVPPGTYKLKAEMEGYRTKETMPFQVTVENVISTRLQLIKLPPPPVEKIAEVLASTETTTVQKAAAVTQVVTEQAAYAAKATIEDVNEVINSPIVEQQVQNTAVPTATAVAVVNVAAIGTVSASGIPYLMYLMSLLAQPTLLFGRRKRKKWGIVYNSLTKRPVDLAIVRLLDARTDRVLRSAVTDKDGRYFFIVQAGEYKLSVSKAACVFPTTYLKGVKEDGEWVDLYHGEVIKASDSTTITANIPIDPVAAEQTVRGIAWKGIGRRFQKALAILSIVAMMVAAYIRPSKIVIALLVVNVLTYLVFRRLSVAARPKNWGIVYDKATGKPIRNALARIFEAKYNKLLETQVTDNKGRYSFLVGRNVYYVTFEKPGYAKEQKGPVDLTTVAKEAEGVISLDIKLEPVATGAKGAGKPGEPGKGAPPDKGPTPPPSDKPSVTPPPVTAPPTTTAPAVAASPVSQPATPAASVAPPAAATAVPPATPPAKPAGEAAKIPWELQMLRQKGAAQPAPAAPAASAPAVEPAKPPAAAPTPGPAAPAASSAKIPWELQMLRKQLDSKKAAPAETTSVLGYRKEDAAPGAPAATPAAPAPVAPTSTKPAAPRTPLNSLLGQFVKPKVPLIEDEEHAHPELKKDQPNKPEEGKPGPN